jgi:hypothetical protein
MIWDQTNTTSVPTGLEVSSMYLSYQNVEKSNHHFEVATGSVLESWRSDARLHGEIV